MRKICVTCITVAVATLCSFGQSLSSEIRAVPGGAAGEFGCLRVKFPADVIDPITVTLPDGQMLTCQARAVVWYNPTTDTTFPLGTLTNSLGVIISPCEVLYSNALQTGIHLKYRVDPSGSLSQFVLFETRPELPAGADWSVESNPVIEAWSQWAGIAPVSIQSRVIAFRDGSIGGEPVEATDQTICFGAVTLMGEGKAFSLADPNDSVVVAKAWRPAEDGTVGGAMLIEGVDWRSLEPRLSSLPGDSHPKSASNVSSTRSALLASLSKRAISASAKGGQPMSVAPSRLMLVAKTAQQPRQAAVIDFTLVCSSAAPQDPASSQGALSGVGTGASGAASGVTSASRGLSNRAGQGSYQSLSGLSPQNGLQVFTPLK